MPRYTVAGVLNDDLRQLEALRELTAQIKILQERADALIAQIADRLARTEHLLRGRPSTLRFGERRRRPRAT